MIKISLPVKLAIQNAKNHGCKTVGEALKFIESDPGYENWVADDVMTTVQQVYGSDCPLDRVAGISAYSTVEMQDGEGEGQDEGEGAEGEGDGKDGGKCATCGKKKKGSKSSKSGKKDGDSSDKGDQKPGDKSGKSKGDGSEEGESDDDSDGGGAGGGDREDDGEGEGDSGDDSDGSGDGDGQGDSEDECEGHDGDGEGDGEGDGDGEGSKGQGDGKGGGRPKDGPGKPSGSGMGDWVKRLGKQWFTKDVLDSPFITRDFDGLAKEAREWKPNKTVGDRVNGCLSQIADLGGDSDDEPDRYHIGKLVTRISTRQGGLQSHCRRNERGRRKVLLLPDISGSCSAFSASALEFCYSAAMVDERIVVIETFDGQIRMPGKYWDSDDGDMAALEKRRSAPFPFTKKHYKEKLYVSNEATALEREKNFIDWIMNGDFCAVIALGDTQGGWLYRALDQRGMKVFWMDPGGYTFVQRHARDNGVAVRSKALSLGRYAPLPPDADKREDGYQPTRDGYSRGWYSCSPNEVKELGRYKTVSYSVNMSHNVEGFIESLELIIKEY